MTGSPGFQRRVPGGRLRVDRAGLVWRDESTHEFEVVLPAAQVGSLRIEYGGGGPQLVVTLARPPGVPADTVSLGGLAELRTSADEVLLQAHAVGIAVEPTTPPPAMPPPTPRPAAAPAPPDGDTPIVVRDSVRLRLRVLGWLSVPVLVFAGLLTWRLAAVENPTVPPLLVAGVAAASWVLMAVLVSRPDVLTVTRDEVHSRSGYDRTAWTVHRRDVSAVAWLRDDSRALTLLVFYDHGGVPVRQAPIPQDQRAVAAALLARGWPLRGQVTGPATR